MGWFGNFLSGGGDGGDDHDYDDDNDNDRGGRRRRRPQTSTTPSSARNSRSRGGGGRPTGAAHTSDYNDDLYLSDDDDWGMSSFSASHINNNSLRHNTNNNKSDHQYYYNDHELDEEEDVDEYYDYDQKRRRRQYGRRSSSSAFWDQISMNDEYTSSGRNSGRRGGGVGPRENLEDEFNDQQDFYRHDQRLSSRAAEDEVQKDIRSLEQENSRGGGGNEEDDNVSSTSSKKEEVANAYRDYLKSIRDGGFESYLDNTTTFTTADGEHANSNNIDEDGALERVLDMEEERASGSLYRDLYGVHDMRGVTSSPYSEWRAKAKALLRQEEVGGGVTKASSSSSSRKILERFRRKRSAGSDGRVAGGNNRSRKRNNNGYAPEDDGRVDEYDTGVLSKFWGYRVALFRHPLFRVICVLLCVLLAFAVGISYYVRSSHEQNNSMTSDVGGGATEHGINAATEQSNTPKHNSSRPSDAILNALSTFEPVWFDRRSGWEGITYMDAVHFCASHKDRVPCPYEIYCNKDDGTPYDGIRPGGEQWAAISNGANQWVQVGEMFTCQRYTDLHDHKKPEWGITGVSSEHEHGAGGITQNIMCCVDVYRIGSLDPFTQWGKNKEMDNVEEDSTKETSDSASVNVVDEDREENPNKGNVAVATENIDAQKQEKAVIAAFQPIWFSTTHGWSGKSYEDAILFCESYNHMVLCPYAAYCPNGHAHSPLPGSMISEVDGEQWAPANGPMNTWVQVGTVDGDESTKCTLHQDMLGERPAWGIDGTRSEVKHHIMCCLM